MPAFAALLVELWSANIKDIIGFKDFSTYQFIRAQLSCLYPNAALNVAE